MTQRPAALVTGAGSGIGRAVALALVEAGWRVAVAGRNHASLDHTVHLAGASADHVATLTADVTSAASVDGLFTAVGLRFGRLDLLFNNAGISLSGSIADATVEDWNATVATNLTGAFLCARGAFRMMRDQTPPGGRIINNGSISAHAPRPNSVAYTATKHAVTGLTRSISLDGRAHNIACGQIDIGNVRTSMAAHMDRGAQQADGRMMTEPLMDLESVCRAVVLMASLPLDANVQDMVIMATNMPFVGRG